MLVLSLFPGIGLLDGTRPGLTSLFLLERTYIIPPGMQLFERNLQCSQWYLRSIWSLSRRPGQGLHGVTVARLTASLPTKRETPRLISSGRS